MASRPHCHGLTGSLTNKTGWLFDALPVNRPAVNLWSPTAWSETGSSSCSLLTPCLAMSSPASSSCKGQAWQADWGGPRVPDRNKDLPEISWESLFSGYFKAFFTGPAKKAQWRFQLDICCGRCSSELVLWAPDPLWFGLTASCVGPRVVGAAVCRPWEVTLTCLPFDALEWQGATGYFSPGLTFLLLRLPGS